MKSPPLRPEMQPKAAKLFRTIVASLVRKTDEHKRKMSDTHPTLSPFFNELIEEYYLNGVASMTETLTSLPPEDEAEEEDESEVVWGWEEWKEKFNIDTDDEDDEMDVDENTNGHLPQKEIKEEIDDTEEIMIQQEEKETSKMPTEELEAIPNIEIVGELVDLVDVPLPENCEHNGEEEQQFDVDGNLIIEDEIESTSKEIEENVGNNQETIVDFEPAVLNFEKPAYDFEETVKPPKMVTFYPYVAVNVFDHEEEDQNDELDEDLGYDEQDQQMTEEIDEEICDIDPCELSFSASSLLRERTISDYRVYRKQPPTGPVDATKERRLARRRELYHRRKERKRGARS